MKLSINKRDKGFTLIEMMVVVGIIVFITALSFASYREGQSQYALQLSAQKLASDLRNAQNMALSTVTGNGEPAPAGGYGIYFNNSAGKNSAYTLFADTNINTTDPDLPAYVYSDQDTKLGDTDLKKGVEIGNISLTQNNTAVDTTSAYVIFTPPDPIITIGPYDLSETSSSPTQLNINIFLTNDSNKCKMVTINKFGKIDIEDCSF